MINKFLNLLNDYDKYANNKREFNNIQDYAYQVPIIGFNSGKYDINMVKSFNFLSISMKITLKLYLKLTVPINCYKHKIIDF